MYSKEYISHWSYSSGSILFFGILTFTVAVLVGKLSILIANDTIARLGDLIA